LTARQKTLRRAATRSPLRFCARTADAQTQLAERLKTDQGNIARLERGGSQATIRTLQRIAEATGHSLIVDFQPLKSSDLPSLQVMRMHQPTAQTEGQQHAGTPTHPEEIRARMRFRVGKSVSLKATVRMTPAGIVSTGVMVAAIFLSITALVRAIRRPS
jgi:transcriptional regulator with XRE-family HTH domain